MTSTAGSETTDRLVAGRYRLRSRLGRGGMGTVWMADDELLGRSVAVKEIAFPPDLPDREAEVLRERTLREARAAARLDHPSAVTVYDVVQEDGWPYIVMELLRARTLAELVRDDGPLSPREAARVGLAVLGALEAAHGLGIVHRDVKPGNIMVRADGRVTLTDFGIATSTGDSTITMTGLLLGSPSYMAPERIEGREPGPPSDLWSLGATLYAAVEGRAPFERDEPLLTLAAVASGQPAPFRNAGMLAPLIQRLMARDPSDRPTASEARDELLAVANRRVREAEPAPETPPALDEPTGAHLTALPRTDVLAAAAAGQQEADERAEIEPAPVVAEPPPKPFFGRLEPTPAPAEPEPEPEPVVARGPEPEPEPVVVRGPDPAPRAEPEPVVVRRPDPVPAPVVEERKPEPPPVAVARPVSKPSTYGYGPPRTREPLPVRQVGRTLHRAWSIIWRLLALAAIVTAVLLFFLLRSMFGGDDSGVESETTQATETGPAAVAPPAEDLVADAPETAAEDEAVGEATPTEDPEQATPTQSAPVAQATDFGEPPPGYVVHTSEAGWSIAYPDGWEVRNSTSSDASAGEYEFVDPGAGRRLRVSFASPPNAPTALQAWEDNEDSLQRSFANYQRIFQGEVEYRGLDAADREYTYTSRGVTLHDRQRGIIVRPGELAFGIDLLTRDEDWEDSEDEWAVFMQTFRPPPP